MDDASVDAMFPYMRIGVKDFALVKDVDMSQAGTNFTEQKEFVLESIALIRLMANIPEFEEAVLNAEFTASTTWTSTEGGASVKKGEKYDNQVLLKIIQNRKYDVRIVRSNENCPPEKFVRLSANVGPVLYTKADYGKSDNTDRLINFPKQDWTAYGRYPWGKNQIPCLMFHEMIHNSGWGYLSDTAGEVPLVIQDITRTLGGRIIGGDLKEKYADAYEGLKTYYKTRYAAQVKAPDTQL